MHNRKEREEGHQDLWAHNLMYYSEYDVVKIAQKLLN